MTRFEGSRRHRNHAFAHAQLVDRHAEPCGCHIEQYSACFGRHAPHRPAIAFHRGRAAGTALVDRDIRAAHDAGGLGEGEVQFVGHDLPEGRSRALAAIRFADVERRGIVLMNHDPRIDLAEVGVGIRTGAGAWAAAGGLSFRFRHERRSRARSAEGHGEHACVPEEVPARGSDARLLQFLFDFAGNAVEGVHAVTSVFADCRASAIAFAPRLMAA